MLRFKGQAESDVALSYTCETPPRIVKTDNF